MHFAFQCAVNAWGPFIESFSASECVLSDTSGFTSHITGMNLDFDTALAYLNPSASPTVDQLANYYAQHAFPLFMTAGSGDIEINSVQAVFAGYYDSNIIDTPSSGRLLLNDAGFYPLCFRFPAALQGLYNQVAIGNTAGTIFGNVVASLIEWNRPYMAGETPKEWSGSRGAKLETGLKPAPYTVPSVLSSFVNTLADPSNLPAIPSVGNCPYPFIYGGTIYQTQPPLDQSGQFMLESNHQFYSYHQSLTASNISGLSWSAKGQTNCVYVDANTMKMMFVGLVIGLTTDSLNYYVVLGIHPGTGYINVYNLGATTVYVSGNKTTVYTGTVIAAQPYRLRMVNRPSMYVNANATAVVGQYCMADTSAGSLTVYAPAALVNGGSPYVVGDQWTIEDYAGTFATHNLTIDHNGGALNGSPTNVVLTTNNQIAKATWVGGTTGWKVTGLTQSVVAPLPPPPLLLDLLSGTAVVAYSTRKIRATYTGPAIRVYNQTTSAQTDIGFAGNDLDTTALAAAAAGTGTLSIITWYDQSGSGNNAVVSPVATSNQVVTNAGVNNLLNGHVAPHWNGVADANCLQIAGSTSQPSTTAVVVATGATVGGGSAVLGALGTQMVNWDGAGHWQIYAGSSLASSNVAAVNTAYGVIAVFNGASSTLTANGVSQITGNPGTGAFSGSFNLGLGYGGTANLLGSIPEFIVFTSALSSGDQSTLNSSWTSYWGA
jgi:hypothetical protein